MTTDEPPIDCPSCYARPRGLCPNCGRIGPRGIDPPSISDEELIEVVMRFAEKRGDGCTWDCPAKHGNYCLDGHTEAYNAREILRSRGYD